MPLGTLPPWLDVSPSLFAQALQSGATLGAHIAGLRQSASEAAAERSQRASEAAAERQLRAESLMAQLASKDASEARAEERLGLDEARLRQLAGYQSQREQRLNMLDAAKVAHDQDALTHQIGKDSAQTAYDRNREARLQRESEAKSRLITAQINELNRRIPGGGMRATFTPRDEAGMSTGLSVSGSLQDPEFLRAARGFGMPGLPSEPGPTNRIRYVLDASGNPVRVQ
jgi:hypothetical protein